MKLIVLTSPDFFVEEDKIIASLFDEGLDLLYLRKPQKEPVYSERLLTLLPDEYHKRVMVYDHFYLKEEFDLLGIHLSKHNTQTPHDYKGLVSRYCYSLADLAAAKAESDYVMLTHVFDSLSDKGVKASYSAEDLHEASRNGLIDRRVIAMGGVCLDNIDKVRALGFGGVAVRGDLWTRFNIHRGTDFKELINHFRKLRKATL